MSEKINKILQNKKVVIGLLIAVVAILIAFIVVLMLPGKDPGPVEPNDPTPSVCTHVYDNDCDNACNLCGDTREIGPHTYSTECDVYCDSCNAVRVVYHQYSNNCDNTCNLCFEIRSVGDHVYDNACDFDCNECGDVRRTGSHVYDNLNDATCNICGAVRDTIHVIHVYDNDCDGVCNECNATRVVSHTYDNGCDIDCNKCGLTRTDIEHAYDNACDPFCNNCNAERSYSHQYASVCSSTCKICGATREVTHFYTNACDIDCNLCGEKRASYHVYDNDADEDCNICGFVRTAYIIWNNSMKNSLLMYPDDFTNNHYLSELVFNNMDEFTDYSMSRGTDFIRTYKKFGDVVEETYHAYKSNGQYNIYFDGTNYEFDIIHNSQCGFPLATPNDIVYNVETGEYSFTQEYAKEYFKVLVGYYDVGFSGDDLEGAMDISYGVQFKLNNKKICETYSKLFAEEMGSEYVIMDIGYQTTEEGVQFQAGLNFLATANVVVNLVPIESGKYAISFKATSGSIFTPVVEEASFNGVLTFTNDDYVMSNEMIAQRNKVETILSQYNTLANQYAGPYLMNDYCSCEAFAIYDADLDVYLILEEVFDEEEGYVYVFAGISSRIDETYGIVMIDGEELVVVQHCYDEDLLRILEDKYAGEFTSDCVDVVISVYDEEYGVYVIFEDFFGDGEYYVNSFSYEYDAVTECLGVLNGTHINITKYSGVDASVSKFMDYKVIGYTDKCEMFCIYLPEFDMYLYYMYIDGELYHSGYGSFTMGCVAIYNEATKTITLSSHAHV